jgi:hypothetical protein
VEIRKSLENDFQKHIKLLFIGGMEHRKITENVQLLTSTTVEDLKKLQIRNRI